MPSAWRAHDAKKEQGLCGSCSFLFCKKKSKKSLKTFAKPLDKAHNVCYNIYIKGRADNPINRRRRLQWKELTPSL
nr:MAG TPA: hypothetical protein [Caudoviricetes sp.]